MWEVQNSKIWSDVKYNFIVPFNLSFYNWAILLKDLLLKGQYL